MNQKELKARLEKEGLLKIYIDGRLLQYVDEEQIMQGGEWRSMTDVYGIYREGDRYHIFFTDAERGIPFYGRSCSNEAEACDRLYERLLRQLEIHQRYVLKYLREYLIREIHYSAKLADAACKDLKRNFDIAEELWITLDCRDFPAPGYYLTVRGYSAEELYNNYKLNILGAYNYLIFLREEPWKALEILKKGLPKK